VSLTPVSDDTDNKFPNQKPFHFYVLTANKDFTAFTAVKKFKFCLTNSWFV